VPALETFVVITIILVTVGLIVVAHYLDEKRKKALMEWAQARRLSFRPDRDDSMGSRYPNFEFLNRGSARYAYNIIQGKHKMHPMCAFDYHYETYSTDSKGHRHTHHHHFSVVVVEANVPLKPLLIRGETFLDKVGEFMGFDDIDFELAEFSRRFHVKSPDRRWAFDVLHQQAMEFLLASPVFTLQFHDRHVAAYRNSVFSTEHVEAALDVVAGLLNRLPNSVLRELKGTN
jgi:hypothetical protein